MLLFNCCFPVQSTVRIIPTFSPGFLTRVHGECVLGALGIKSGLGGLGRGSPQALLPQGGFHIKPVGILQSLQISVLYVVIYNFLGLKNYEKILYNYLYNRRHFVWKIFHVHTCFFIYHTCINLPKFWSINMVQKLKTHKIYHIKHKNIVPE